MQKRPNFLPPALVAYVVLVLALHGVCRLLEIRFSEISAYVTLAFLTDFLYNERWLKRVKTVATEGVALQDSISLAVQQVAEDHFVCQLGDIRRLESGWMAYPKDGQIAGPFNELHDAVSSLAEQHFIRKQQRS